MENSNYKLYWERAVIKGQTIMSNRPDIFVRKK